MSIGYACLTVGVPLTQQKGCIKKYASEAKLLEIIDHNLKSLENIIEYNCKNHIQLFRISSDLIPFGSSPVNQLKWWETYSDKFLQIGKKIQENNIRVSMHPGQYTVLNSQKTEVVERAMEELNYHARVLDSLKAGTQHKIVLHIGGVYNDKQESIDRFITNYQKLDIAVKRRLVIENDDKSYTISDVLKIGRTLNIPVIFDNLHHRINQSQEKKSEFEWIEECRKTWKEEDGIQKIHYSQQHHFKNIRSHSETIGVCEFLSFYDKLNRKDIDIMLEVKDKNLSAVKCINCTAIDKNIKALELEWSKYKYSVLENSPNDYVTIRNLLKNKKEYPAISFYTLLEKALEMECNIGNSVNAAQHVWSYFKNVASEKEKKTFLENLEKYQKGKITIARIKNNLWKLAVKYDESYLLESYYFL